MPQFLEHKEIAKSELKRRGTNISSDVEITPHSIDNASLRVRKIWHNTKKKNEGIYTWLSRVANEAVKEATDKPERIEYLGIKFVFKWGNKYPNITKSWENQQQIKITAPSSQKLDNNDTVDQGSWEDIERSIIIEKLK